MATALVTGAARRLGAAIAEGLATRGWHVVLHYHGSDEEAAATCDRIAAAGGSAEIAALDLADQNAVPGFVHSLAERRHDWRLLVNNAALFEPDDARAMDPAVWSRAAAVNLVAPVLLAQHFARATDGRGDRRIINLVDQKLDNPNPDYFSYTLSKAGLGMATQLMAMAMADDPGLRLFDLAPGLILPSGDQTEAEFEQAARMNLLDRPTGADAVADAVAFLASAPMASGQRLFIDSGQHLVPQPRDVMFLARGER